MGTLGSWARNLCISILEFKCKRSNQSQYKNRIYVFLYQNLNVGDNLDFSTLDANLCISILEFKLQMKNNIEIKFEFMYFYIRI